MIVGDTVVTRDAEDRFLMAVLGCVILLFVGFTVKVDAGSTTKI